MTEFITSATAKYLLLHRCDHTVILYVRYISAPWSWHFAREMMIAHLLIPTLEQRPEVHYIWILCKLHLHCPIIPAIMLDHDSCSGVPADVKPSRPARRSSCWHRAPHRCCCGAFTIMTSPSSKSKLTPTISRWRSTRSWSRCLWPASGGRGETWTQWSRCQDTSLNLSTVIFSSRVLLLAFQWVALVLRTH